MAILSIANNLWFNLILFIMIACFVVFMPIVDMRVCKKLGLNVRRGISTNPNAYNLLLNRRFILCAILGVYVLANLYLVFFSRRAAEDYMIHVAPLAAIGKSIRLDSDFLHMAKVLFEEGPRSATAQIHIVKTADISQALMNMLLYVPMGYLLPYVFDWFKKNVSRPLLVSAFFSLATENLQLITRRGCYDLDDFIFNTLGALVGIFLFRQLVYFMTHPTWRKDWHRYLSFKHRARSTALSRLSKTIDCGRVTLLATLEEPIYEFYVEKLGFYLQGQKVPPDSDASSLLLDLGGLSVEFLCSNREETIPSQRLLLYGANLDRIKKRLEKRGITVSPYFEDIYLRRRSMFIMGPDDVKISFVEY